MPVKTLELENFKSYAGKHTIGRFSAFTCVIGPNGSGKSNLMDALSFVLGVASRDLRSQQLKDLIFRPPNTSVEDVNLSCRVSLVYEMDDGSERRYTRNISKHGVSEYRVDDDKMSRKEYEEALAELGVLVQARNFLVFQGDVENLARKSPSEMVDLIEHISGSIEYKEQYETLKQQKDEAESAKLFSAKQKKSLESERHIFKQQKDEAARFDNLLEERNELMTNLYLFLLYNLDQDKKEKETNITELQEELESAQEAENEKAAELSAAKKASSQARRATQKLEQDRVSQAAKIDKLEPTLLRSQTELKNLKKKLSNDEKQLANKKKELENHGSTLEDLDKQIAEFQQTKEDLINEYEDKKQDNVMTAEQEEEYAELREAANAASAEPKRALAKLNRKLQSARSQIPDAQEAESTEAQIEKDLAELTARQESLEKSLATTNADLESTEKELRSVQAAQREAQTRRDELDVEIEKLSSQLRDAKNYKKQTKEEERLKQAIKTLQGHFPGVQGRLVDLCRPTMRKYFQAVTVAAGRDMDSIVVDTKQTAVECIQYLRDQKVGTATFLPLDTLQTPHNTDAVRQRISSDSRYRMAVDLIHCKEESIEKAVAYAVGNTVVADNLDAARELCFTKKENVKAVTLQGAVISKAGTMTGGQTRDDDSGSRWKSQDVEKMIETKETLEHERSEIERTMRGQNQLEKLRNDLGTLQNRKHFSQSELEYTIKSIQGKKTLFKATSKEVATLKKKISASEKNIAKIQAQVKAAAEQVKAVENEHLGPFIEKTGLKDLTAYEETMGKARDDFLEKKRAIVEHITQLEQQKEYEVGRDLKQPVARIEKRIKERKAALAKEEKKVADLQEKVNEAREELAEAEAKLAEANESEKEFDEAVQNVQASFKEAQSVTAQLKKQISQEEAGIERLRGKLHETLQKSRVEKVELPLVGEERGRTRSRRSRGGDMEDEESQPQTLSSQRSASETQESSRGLTQYSQDDDPVVVRDQNEASKVDFSSLSKDLQRRLSDREERKIRKDFEDKIAKISAEIESMTPNMKASEAFSAATERLKDSKTDHEKAKEGATKAIQAFMKIKQKRTKRFMEAYNIIEESLKTIYRDITKSSKHPLGGNAYLSLDDTEEPYKGGLKFNAMPPMKRFRDMEQLSGGEKTVAALSLLFAIHSFHPAPFFVMDEVDAALDNINLRKVCNYIRQRSQMDFQCIVISLKDLFYEHSQSLVGICRDVASNSSHTLTLDLTQFDGNANRRKRSRASDGSTLTSPPSKRASSLSLGRSPRSSE